MENNTDKENVENLETAKSAIVDILTQYYLEELNFNKNESGNTFLFNKSEEILADSHGLKEKLKGQIRIVKPNAYHIFGGTDYSAAQGIQEGKKPKVKGYGTIYYLLTAMEVFNQGNRLYSQRKGALTEASFKTWQRFERHSLAESIEKRSPESENSGRFRFIDFSNIELEDLKNKAQQESKSIKSTGKIEEAINEIQKRLSSTL